VLLESRLSFYEGMIIFGIDVMLFCFSCLWMSMMPTMEQSWRENKKQCSMFGRTKALVFFFFFFALCISEN